MEGTRNILAYTNWWCTLIRPACTTIGVGIRQLHDDDACWGTQQSKEGHPPSPNMVAMSVVGVGGIILVTATLGFGQKRADC